MDDFRRIFYGVLIGFVLTIVLWISFLTFRGCGSSLNCANAGPTAEHTAIPSLMPATLPPLNQLLGVAAPAGTEVVSGPTSSGAEVARPSNPGGAGEAVSLKGDPKAGEQVFTANCQVCHAAEGKGGNPNPGSTDGTVPPLNPIDSTLVSSDSQTYATNVDLFIEHGSTPAGPAPTFSMPAWGDKKLLTPQQIADVLAYIISLNPAPSAQATAAPTAGGAPEVARPSNPGGAGQAVSLKGDPKSGQQLFTANCQVCHAAEGKGGSPNPGSDDGTVPALNPIDPTLVASDYQTFATNIDLFIEHGSTPSGTSPTFLMPAWGDKKLLTPQQIADIISYVISLNGGASAQAPSGTAAPSAPPTATEGAAEVARPSNPGGPGPAISLGGDVNSGQQIFVANCQICHAAEGKGGNPNPGSTDGTIPPLNPIDPTLKDPDAKIYATNIDLFIEHGSTPAGPGPTFSMPAWGDKNLLTPQQIADVIAYIESLNK